jgi:hypothetical protein
MTKSPTRYPRLISELPKHKNISDAIEAAGFSRSTARKQQKRVLRSALKDQARGYLDDERTGGMNSKQLMSEIVGLGRIELFEVLKKILFQDKDYSSALKVLAPLIAQHGVELKAEEGDKITVPVLNVMIEKSSPIIEGGEAVNTQ